jgi:predicted Holliday junction resolvase-like endonuclease
MGEAQQAKQVINDLISRAFVGRCPHCDETFRLKSAGLFYISERSEEADALHSERTADVAQRSRELRERQVEIPKDAEARACATRIGQMAEHLAPTLDGFPFDSSDCRCLLKPIDYIVFDGLHSRQRVERIVFVDIKTGGSSLSGVQRSIRDAATNGCLELAVYSDGERVC